MLNNQQFNLLRLVRSENVGNVTLRKLIDKYSNAENAIKNIDEINSKLKRKIKLATEKDIKQEANQLAKLGGFFLFEDDENYPEQLKFISDNPVVLTCLGNIDLLKRKQVAVVGARSVSVLGLKLTRKMAGTLAKKGYVVTSGLARGVDSLAHLGALDENGATIAVLGSSVDFCYPAENKELYDSILANGGLIISENKVGSGIISKHQFPKRNRIITALSEAVVVTECTKKSGSLITAKLALEMGKELFAVPGHPLDKHFEGTNDLIKQSCAHVLTNIDDLLNVIGEADDYIPSEKTINQEKLELFDLAEEYVEFESESTDILTQDLQVVDVIIDTPKTIDEIIRLTSLPESEVATQIGMLELEGKLKRFEGGRVCLI
ncbi:MAG: hypothetical protein CFH44_00419 [Proteobacteria bacterium]|nr:MAG: hypothetical protein CFH44_00419 [Pseudomonadota bacterium]